MSVVYLNGNYLPLEKASVSVLDRGFTFSDGVYEVLPVFYGKIFRFDEHIGRLDSSLSAIRINNPHSRDEWKEICETILERNPSTTGQSVYIQITRGVGDRNHVYGAELKPTVFAMCRPVGEKIFTGGIKAITHEDIRWKYCYIKSTALLANVLLRQHAFDAGGAGEAILIRGGRLTEGAASNVFVVRDEVIKTPEKDGAILPGITRDLVVELLQNSGYQCLEAIITEAELREADEIWITSSTIGIVPVTALDGAMVGTGRPGPMWERANAKYMSYIKELQQDS